MVSLLIIIFVHIIIIIIVIIIALIIIISGQVASQLITIFHYHHRYHYHYYHYCLFIIVSVQVVSLLRHALQPCISNVTVDWGLGDDDKPGPGSIEVETKKTLFGYGKPKSSPDSPSDRWQAPAKV